MIQFLSGTARKCSKLLAIMKKNHRASTSCNIRDVNFKKIRCFTKAICVLFPLPVLEEWKNSGEVC